MGEASTIARYDLDALSAGTRARLLYRRPEPAAADMEAARAIIEAVRSEGDSALVRYARDHDQAELDLDSLQANDGDFVRAFEQVDPDVMRAIDYAIDNIRRFHEAQMPGETWLKEIRPGAFAGERCRPIASVACHVPRGCWNIAMMTAIPAVVANVGRIIMLTSAESDGSIDALTLVTAAKIGIGEIYKSSGAQAVAAAAFGTPIVPGVVKIVGPGGRRYAAAKRLLADQIDTGPLSGPADALVLADDSSDGDTAASALIGLINEAFTGAAWLVTTSPPLADSACRSLQAHLAASGANQEHVGGVLGGDQGGVVLASSMDEAVDFVNCYAPERLALLTADPFALISSIENAGQIILGPQMVQDRAFAILGPNTVVPPAGGILTASPLSTLDFIKRSAIGYATPSASAELGAQARRLAEATRR